MTTMSAQGEEAPPPRGVRHPDGIRISPQGEEAWPPTGVPAAEGLDR
jgi:hypothetical protein